MKRICCGLFIMLLFLYNGNALAESRAAILIERSTGRVLYEKNAHEALPMASTTKVMTALLALENADLNERVTTGIHAFGVPGTSIYLSEGETLSMEEMLYGLMLASGNDAAVAIAEHVGGSLAEFCQMMTERARELGCESTAFLTPHGLPKSGHYTTASDLAIIARAAMEHETFRKIVSTKQYRIPWEGHDYERVLNNKNKLLSSYPGADGVKTGYTAAAGRCLVFSATRDDLSLIGVVLNCPDWFDEATQILDRGFNNWQMVTLLKKGEAVKTIKVLNGVEKEATLCAAEDVKAPVPLDEWPEIVISSEDTAEAPVKAGEKFGTVSLSDRGEILTSIPLIVQSDVRESTFRHALERLLNAFF